VDSPDSLGSWSFAVRLQDNETFLEQLDDKIFNDLPTDDDRTRQAELLVRMVSCSRNLRYQAMYPFELDSSCQCILAAGTNISLKFYNVSLPLVPILELTAAPKHAIKYDSPLHN
jgi:hypothetical protein